MVAAEAEVERTSMVAAEASPWQARTDSLRFEGVSAMERGSHRRTTFSLVLAHDSHEIALENLCQLALENVYQR
jgi:hypothetical protein